MRDRVLVLDFETTGLIETHLDARHPEQVRPVSVAAMLVEADLVTVMAQLYSVIRPDGWIVPPDASAVHGITHEQAMREGRPLRDVWNELAGALLCATRVVAHNLDYDARVYTLQCEAFGFTDRLASVPSRTCTMKASTEMVGLPKSHGRGNKWPRLTELHAHLFGAPHTGAHHALLDVQATLRCYRALVERRVIAA